MSGIKSRSSQSRSRSDSIERRNKSNSPESHPIKKRGLYNPPKSDYLRYEKREKSESLSPEGHVRKSAHRSTQKLHSRPVSSLAGSSSRSRSPRRRNKSLSRGRSPPKRSKSPRRRSRTPHRRDREQRSESLSGSGRSTSPPKRSKSPRRRSETHECYAPRGISYVDPNMPHIFMGGQYWILAPRGFQPPPVISPPNYCPMYPRFPMTFQPFGHMYRPRFPPHSNKSATPMSKSLNTEGSHHEGKCTIKEKQSPPPEEATK